MKKLFCSALAAVFALASFGALACQGADKGKDEQQMSTPSKPKT